MDRLWTVFWTATCVTQALWSIVFPSSVDGACVLIWVAWFALVCLQYTSMRKLERMQAPLRTKILNYFLLVAPFSIHLGWMTAASCLNINLVANAANATAQTQLTIALLTLVWVVAFSWSVAVRGADAAMAGAACWALAAVSKRNWSLGVNTQEQLNYNYPNLVTGALSSASGTGALILGLGAVLRLGLSAYRVFTGHRDRLNKTTQFETSGEALQADLLKETQ